MKQMKTLISSLLSVILFSANAVMPAYVSAADQVVFSDDFESYALTSAISGTAGVSNTIVDGYWQTSASLGGDTNNSYAVSYDKTLGNGYDGGNVPTTNKTLALTPTSGTGGAAMGANLTFDADTLENYTFTADVRNSYEWSQTPVSGIRIYSPDNEADYYELALLTPQEPNNYVYSEYDGALAGSLAPRFTKVKGATDYSAAIKADSEIPDEWLATAYSPEAAVTMLHKVKKQTGSDYELRTTWFTLSLTKIDDIICWKIFDKERDKTVWEASYIDDTPLFDEMGRLQLFVYGNGANNTIWFDNVTLSEVDLNTFEIPDEATLTEKSEPGDEPEPDPTPEFQPSYDVTPDTPLYLLKDTIEGHQLYTPVGSKAEDIMNNVPSHATGYSEVTSDIMVDGYWATSSLMGGTEWFNDYCVQYDEVTGNGWSGSVTSPIGQGGSTPNEANKVIALKPSYNEQGQLCVLNLAKNLGDADDFIYSVDVRNFFYGTVNPVAGIRVASPTDDTSYYELALISNGASYDVDHDGARFEKPRFTKVAGGSKHTPKKAAAGGEPSEWKYVDYGSVGTASGMYRADTYQTGWFTLTLAKKDSTIYWSIIDKATGEAVWEDSYRDSDPLFDGLGRLQLFAYGGGECNAPTLFDNIDAKKLGTKLFHYTDIADTFCDDFTANAIDSVPDGYSSPDKSFKVKYDKLNANFWGQASDTDLTDNKVLWLEGAGKLNYTAGTANTYTVDIRNYFYGVTNPVSGIRILDPNNEKNYYELALLSGKDAYNSPADAKLYPPRFTKVQGAKDTTPAISDTAPSEVLYIENCPDKVASGLYSDGPNGRSHSTDRFTLELGKDDNEISFRITDKATNSVIWNRKWTDEAPLFDGAGILQIFSYGADGQLIIDNVSGVAMGDSGLRIEASWVKESKSAPFIKTADYDENGRLISVSDIDAPIGNKGYYFSPKSLTLSGVLKKLFLWDENTNEPLTPAAQYQEGDIEECRVTYPGFVTKAFSVSVDDGSDQDSVIIPIMKKYGIKATFNLTGSQWTNYDNYVYEDFEVANHTTHIEMFNEQYSYDDCINSIEEAYSIIKEKTGADSKGLIWPYRAPKERTFWNEIYAYTGANYEYAREAGESYDFSAPLDWLQWNATAWSNNWRTYTDRFLALEESAELKMLTLACHAFDTPSGEASMQDLCEYVFSKVGNDDSIWKATNLELCKYSKAVKALEITSKNVYNPSRDVTVYMLIDGEEYVAYPESFAQPMA